MKKFIKNILYWIKFDKYLPLVDLVLGIIVFIVVWKNSNNIYLGIICGIIISIITIIITHIYCIDKYTDESIMQKERLRYYDYEDLKGYSKNIDDIIELDKSIVEFLDKYSSHKKNDFREKELNKQWKIHGDEFMNKAHNIFSKMNNPELLLSLLVTEEVAHMANVYQYFKPFEMDLNYLKKHPDKAYEYYLENLMQKNTIKDYSINEYCYKRLMDLNYFKEIEEVILSYMSNEELLELAKSSRDWEEKIKFYGYLSKDKRHYD